MNTFTVGNARFTVMTEGAVRLEYAKNGKFVDRPTLFAQRNAVCDAECKKDGDTVIISTPKFTLRYTGNEPFSAENLEISVHTAGVDTVVHYGDENLDNMRGTLSTVDNVSRSVETDSKYGFVDAIYGNDTQLKTPDGLIARDGWHFVDDSAKPFLTDNWIEERSEDHLIDTYFFAYGHDYKCALRDFTAVSGKAVMPRKCYMGAWYSRWYQYTTDQFLEIIDEYKSHDFPLDVLVIDLDWHYHDWCVPAGDPRRAEYGYGHAAGNMGWTCYTWNRNLIPDPQYLIDEIHKRGITVTLSDHPADGIRDNDEIYPEFIKYLEDAGYEEQVPDVADRISDREKAGLSRGVKNFRFNAGSPVYMEAFFKAAFDKMTDMGIDYWWLDWQQDYLYPVVNGYKNLTHLEWLNYLYYNRSKKGGRRGQGFSRWAGWGDQKHPGAFSGDISSVWSALHYEIQMTVSAGNMGCFWWTHDIGGFFDPTGKQSEIYARWVQFGIFSAALRTHSCGNVNGVEIDRRPWKWGEPFCSSIRLAFHLRSRLMPYLYSVAYKSQNESLPLLRALYYDMPECEEAYRHPETYFFGDGFFVAPIYTPGSGENYEVTKDVWIPEGQWYDWFSGKRYESGKITVTNGLFSFPLFAKAGYPIVEQPYQERMTTALLTDPIVKIFAGAGDIEGKAELFEDDGITDKFENGEMRLTEISYKKTGNVHNIKFAPSGKGYEGCVETRSTLTVELRDVDALTEVSEGELSYNEEKRIATVTLHDVPADRAFEITVK